MSEISKFGFWLPIHRTGIGLTRTMRKQTMGIVPFSRSFDSIFDAFVREAFNDSPFINLTNPSAKIGYPMNVLTDKKTNEIVYKIAAVGLDEKDISIEQDGRRLSITSQISKSEEDTELMYKGLKSSKFQIEVIVPNDYDIEGLKASLDKGLLEIRIPQSEKAQLKKIPIYTKQNLLTSDPVQNAETAEE